jgi:mannan endo-1,4-beta-mannosidase
MKAYLILIVAAELFLLPFARGQFKVSGRYLEDNKGNIVLIRGVNVPIYGSGYSNDITAVSNAIKNNTKANAVRMLWYSSAVQNDIGNPPYYASLTYLDNAITAYTSLGILPIIYLADLTAVYSNSISSFNSDVVPFWTSSAVISLIKKHQPYLIINLENEWGATWDPTSLGSTPAAQDTNFVNTYINLVKQLRRAGVTVPIMIDAPDGGSNGKFLITNGASLEAKDSLHNILLSVHTYWTVENGIINTCPADYHTYLQDLQSSGLPFIFGEVSDWAVASDGTDYESTPPVNFVCPAKGSSNQYAVDYDAILNDACDDEIGYLAWAWYQDGLYVRNIYNQSTGTSINTAGNANGTYAGSWPTDMLSSSKCYGLNNTNTNVILPVSFLSFTAALQGKQVELQWKTATENKSGYFNIERSSDGINFSTIGSVNAVGNSTAAVSYNYTDHLSSAVSSASIIYYRIMEKDGNGKITLSKVLPVKLSNSGTVSISLFPDPATSKATLVFDETVASGYTITLTDMWGRSVRGLRGVSNVGTNTITVDVSDCAKGMYMIILEDNEHGRQVIKLNKE